MSRQNIISPKKRRCASVLPSVKRKNQVDLNQNQMKLSFRNSRLIEEYNQERRIVNLENQNEIISFKIFSFCRNEAGFYEEALQSEVYDQLNKQLPNDFGVTSIYGRRSDVKSFLCEFFGYREIIIEDSDGVYCLFKKNCEIVIVVYVVSEDEMINPPILETNRLNFVLRLLVDVSDTIIPIIPDNFFLIPHEILQWFYEEEGKLNPFNQAKLLSEYENGTLEKQNFKNLSSDARFRIMKDKFQNVVEVKKKYFNIRESQDFEKKKLKIWKKILNIDDVKEILSLQLNDFSEIIDMSNNQLICTLRDAIQEFLTERDNKIDNLTNLLITRIFPLMTEKNNQILQFFQNFLKKEKDKTAKSLFKKIKKSKTFTEIKSIPFKTLKKLTKKTFLSYLSELKPLEVKLESEFNKFINPLNILSIMSLNFSLIKYSKSSSTFKIKPLKISKDFEFKYEKVKVTQIVSFESNFVLISFSNELSSTYLKVINFNKLLKNFELKFEINDPCIKIAWNSKLDSCFLFEENKKIITCRNFTGTYDEYLTIYNTEDLVIKTFYYLTDPESLIILSKSGNINILDIQSKVLKDIFHLNKHKSSEITHYIDLCVSPNQKLLILLSNSKLEIFLLKSFKKILTKTLTIQVPDSSKALKKLTCYENNEKYFILAQKQSKISKFQLYEVFFSKKLEEIERLISKTSNPVPGNPLVDSLHLSFTLFGDLNKSTDLLNHKRKLLYNIQSEASEKIENYLKNLPNLKKTFENINFTKKPCINNLKVKKTTFLSTVCKKLPVHIAKLSKGLMIPLTSGKDSFNSSLNFSEGEEVFQRLFESLSFSHLERFLQESGSPFVFSALGQDNFFNYLIGSRSKRRVFKEEFGIWLSYGQINTNRIFLLECEGFFDETFNMQDKTKALLLMWSVSDFVFLFPADQPKIRGTLPLLIEMMKNKVIGSSLFYSQLIILSPETEEFFNFGAFLVRCEPFFIKDFKVFSLPSYQKQKEFKKKIQEIRGKIFDGFKKKWEFGSDLNIMLKVVICQLFTDDIQTAEARFNAMKIIQIRNQAELFLKNQKIQEAGIPDSTFVFQITLPGGESFRYEKKFKDIDLSVQTLYNLFIHLKGSDELNTKNIDHNFTCDQIITQIESFTRNRKQILANHFASQIKDMKGINKEFEVVKIENMILSDCTDVGVCLNRCKFCELYCVDDKEKDHHCNCETNHICGFKFIKAGKTRSCNLFVGHLEPHKKRRTFNKYKKCKEKCERCHDECILMKLHQSHHKCAAIHQCPINCSVPGCDSFCKEPFDLDHQTHICLKKKCGFKCELNENHECCSLSHTHHFEIEGFGNHLCGRAHVCNKLCSIKANCSVDIVKSVRKYQSSTGSFEYDYWELKGIKNYCTLIIPGMKISHDFEHYCGQIKHFCDAKCPDCGTFCEKTVSHQGPHESSKHRNKDQARFISSEKIFKEIVQDKEGKKLLAEFMPGDCPTPLNCEQYCLLKGQGHVHSVKCKSPKECHENKKIFSVKHHPSPVLLNGIKTSIDLFECSSYWKYQNWIPPVEMLSKQKQIEFGKCKFFCGHKEHIKKIEIIFCQDLLFHTSSNLPHHHSFQCSHKDLLLNDIVFIIDCTGSMEPYFEKCKNTINKLVEKWGTDASRFAVVGFTDHYPNNGSFFPENSHVLMFPESGELSDGDSQKVGEFISQFQADGGGGNQGEALIDGLAQANKLKFRMKSQKMFVVITDDCPHGPEFNAETCYPEGCPCGISWKEQLTIMKERGILFLFVKLSYVLNKTMEVFREFYGNRFIELSLDNIEEFDVKVSETIAMSFDQNLLITEDS